MRLGGGLVVIDPRHLLCSPPAQCRVDFANSATRDDCCQRVFIFLLSVTPRPEMRVVVKSIPSDARQIIWVVATALRRSRAM